MEKLFKTKLFLEFLLMISLYIFYFTFIKIKFNHTFEFFYLINDLLFILFFLLLIHLVKSWKVRFVLIGLWNTIIYALFLTNTFLITFKNDIFSFNMLTQAAMGFGMLGSYNVFTSLSKVEWILNVSTFLLSFYFLFKIEKNIEVKPRAKNISPVAIVANAMVIFISFLLIPNNDKELFAKPYYNKIRAFEKFGLLTYQITDTNDFLTKNAPLPEEAIEDVRTYLNEDHQLETKDENFGLLKNKNVIIVMMEGVESYLINEKYTPNLYFLQTNSNYFPNMYSSFSNIGTYDAEFKTLTSSMYYRGDNYYNYYTNNAYPFSLPNILKNNDYTANSFHNYFASFYNRENMHPALGFENFYSVDKMNYNFVNDEVPQWPNDAVMFANMKDLYAPIQDKPFLSYILTVSTHGAYDYERPGLKKYYDILKTDPLYADKELNYLTYQASAMDLDEGIGIMLDDLRQKNLLNDTLLVVVSDHKNYSDMTLTKTYKNLSSIDPYSIEKIPLFIYNPLLGAKSMDKKVSHYDLTPTILDLLGIDIATYSFKNLYYGQSVYLNKPIKPIILGYYNWFDDDYISYNGELYDRFGNLLEKDSNYEEKRLWIQRTIEVHNNIFKSNYFNLVK